MADIKLCGLCSKMVEEAMQPNTALRAFLLRFLSLLESELPAKVCADCYQGATECRKFKEQCDIGIDRLRSGRMPGGMILGWGGGGARVGDEGAGKKGKAAKSGTRKSKPVPERKEEADPEEELPDDLQARRVSRSTAASEAAASTRSSRSSGPPPDPLALPATPRTSRSSRQSSAGHHPSPAVLGKRKATPAARRKKEEAGGGRSIFSGTRTFSVVLQETDLTLADQAAGLGGQVRIKQKKRNTWEIDSPGARRGKSSPSSSSVSALAVEPPAKKAKVTPAASQKKKAQSPKTKTTVSSFGRVRRSNQKNRDFDYVDLDEDDLEKEMDGTLIRDPYAAKATPRSRGAIRTAADHPNPPKKKVHPAGPASRKSGGRPKSQRAKPKSRQSRGDRAKPGGFYYVDDEGEVAQPVSAASSEPLVPEEYEEDAEETFPSLGPYQCEICQHITDTKQQFVNHIKSFHLEVVDEEVLRSLENDLKKNKKKKIGPGRKNRGGSAQAEKKEDENNRQQEKASAEEVGKKVGPKSRTVAPVTETLTNTPDSTNREDFASSVTVVDSRSILEGEVTSEEAHVSSNNSHWKASVARKYEQEKGAAVPAGSDAQAAVVSAVVETTAVATGGPTVASPPEKVPGLPFVHWHHFKFSLFLLFQVTYATSSSAFQPLTTVAPQSTALWGSNGGVPAAPAVTVLSQPFVPPPDHSLAAFEQPQVLIAQQQQPVQQNVILADSAGGQPGQAGVISGTVVHRQLFY